MTFFLLLNCFWKHVSLVVSSRSQWTPTPRPTPAPCLFWKGTWYWHTAVPIHLCNVTDCSWAAMAEYLPQTVWPTKPNAFSTWFFTDQACRPLGYRQGSPWVWP